MRRKFYYILFTLGFFVPLLAGAANPGVITPASQTARMCTNDACTTYNRLNFITTHGTPVSVSDSSITGNAWSENWGWINFAPAQGGVHNTIGGVLSGYAWGETTGWINFSPTHGGVTIDTSTGNFLGWAWSQNTGWIHFDCSLSDACVNTDWRPIIPVCTIDSFDASPTTISPSGSSTLTWTTSNCTSASITNVGSVSTSGSQSVSPSITTSYILNATGANGSPSQSVVVTVSSGHGGGGGQCVIDSFSANPTSVSSGGSSVLSWSANSNCTSVTLTGGSVSGNYGTVATLSTGALTTNTDYTLVGHGSNGDSAPSSVSVNVVSNNVGTCSILSFDASPTSVNSGNSSLLSWATNSYCTSVTLAGGTISGNYGALSTLSTGALSGATTYSLIAHGASGDTTPFDVTVSVITPNGGGNPQVCTLNSFSANPTSVSTGASSVLSWSTNNACSSVVLLGGSISGTYGVFSNGLSTGSLYSNTTYTLIAGGASGHSQTLAVTVSLLDNSVVPPCPSPPGAGPCVSTGGGGQPPPGGGSDPGGGTNMILPTIIQQTAPYIPPLEPIGIFGIIAALLASMLGVLSNVFSRGFGELWSRFLAAFGFGKRNKPWGTVYDSVTKQPLDPAYVILRNSDGQEVASSITDLDGRYGFVAPKVGTYSLFVNKTNYIFPSQKLVGHDHDEVYRDLYFGEYFKIEKEGEIIIRNIPMDPLRFDWNEYAKREQGLMKFYSKRESWIGHLADVLFYVGFAFSLFAVYVMPSIYNYAVVALYCVLVVLRRTVLKARPFGAVIEKDTKLGVPFAILRFAYAETKVEIMHRITDGTGHYYCLLPNGNYVVQVERKLPDGTYFTVAKDIPVTVSHGYLAKAFEI